MLKIHVLENELFDERTNEFIKVKDTTLKLEHSLISISKWEEKWHKPFLSDKQKTPEETIDYIKCMSLSSDVDDNVISLISQSDKLKIEEYISTKATATWFSERKSKGETSSEQITSELIYYWMIAYNIPSEYQKWHLSRLLTLIQICNVKNAPEEKMSESEIISRNKELNAARRKALNSKG